MSSNLEPFPSLPESSTPNRPPAPSPCRSCVVSKAGWFTALVAALVAAFFFFRFMSAKAEAKLEHHNAELSQIEFQSVRQKLYAERILAERQISDIANASKAESTQFVRLMPTDGAAPHSTVIAVWLPARQNGVLFADQLPSVTPDEELHLWLEEAGSGSRIAAGTVAATPGQALKIDFKTEKPVVVAARFTITRERKGSSLFTGPTLLSGNP